jgi:Transposase DNA-binding/Transposase DDE domain
MPRLSTRAVERIVGDFAEVELGDPRRTRRLLKIMSRLAAQPAASLPAALRDEAEVEGAYRLINNEAVSFETLLGEHAEATKRRAEAAGEVLVLHDTTPCSFPSLSPKEIGYLPTGKAGFPLHLSLVLDGSNPRRPLGIIHAEALHRRERFRWHRTVNRSGSVTAKQRHREFDRWWRGMEASGAALSGCKSVIHVADREGDSFSLLDSLVATSQRFIIRVRANRRGNEVGVESLKWSTVKQVAEGCHGLVEREVPLSRRAKKSAPGMNRTHPPRKKRLARLRFAATRIQIPRPRYSRDSVAEVLELGLVHVIESNPPPDEPAVEWLLYTTEPIDTPEQVTQVVDNYRARWTIEEFNAALKTGCAYEARQFESRQALLTMLALSLPIACELLWLRSRARSDPFAPATDVLTPRQIVVLRQISSRPLTPNPTARDALLAVAALGGHLKHNGDPGWRILQRGLATLHDYEAGWIAADSFAHRSATCDE